MLIPLDHSFDLLLIHHIHVILLNHLVLTHLRLLLPSLLLIVPDLVLVSLTLKPLLNPLKLLERPHVHLRVHEFSETDTVRFGVSQSLLPLKLSRSEVGSDLVGEVVQVSGEKLVLEAERQVLVLENAIQEVQAPLGIEVRCVLLKSTLDVLRIVTETKKYMRGE